MPTYDYVCKFCEDTFEHFQGINDALLKKCRECGRMGLVRQFGIGAGVVFKGSGFYETDYKRKEQPGKKETSGSDDSKGNGSDSASSEAGKPTKKAAEKPDKPSQGGKKPSSQKSDD